ncbi:hypothetical protein I4U23_015199 [Adineta vaga]|nr:hypothetical protein I4U23_015199 [Adineta vaga]
MDNHPVLKNLVAEFQSFFKQPWQQYIPVFHYIMLSDRLIFHQDVYDELVVLYQLNDVQWKCSFLRDDKEFIPSRVELLIKNLDRINIKKTIAKILDAADAPTAANQPAVKRELRADSKAGHQ